MPAMRVGAIVFPGYEFMFLARDTGKLVPDLVRLVELQSSSDTLRALAAGQLEAGAMTLDEMMAACADGMDLRAVLMFDSSFGADQVLARPGITLKNLQGQKIAVEDNSVGALVFASLLDSASLDIGQMRKVPMNQGRALEFYQQRKADVIVTAEPWASQLRQLGANLIFDSKQMPGLIVDVLAVTAAALQTHARCITHLIQMHFQARRLYQTHNIDAEKYLATRLQVKPSELPAMYAGLYFPDREENIALLSAGGRLSHTMERIQSVMLAARLMRPGLDTQPLLEPRFVSRKPLS
jgi:NitT/TauT family transport system substrate-binding protein